jgi:signal transduction histidine kinase
MKANTAIALILLAVGWSVPRKVAIGLGAFVIGIGIVVLAEYALQRSLGIDQLVFTDPACGSFPGRLSIVTAACVALLAVARLLVLFGRSRWAQGAALVTLLVGALVLLGYAYGVTSLYSVRPFSAMALPTGVAIELLSLAALASVPDGAFRRIVLGHDAAALLVRRLLPVALVGLPLIGFACLLAQRDGVVGGGATLALLVVICAVLVGLVTWAAALRVARVDLGRTQAMEELTYLKTDLERQVQERALQLQRRRNQVAVLEDRQRIAADLHDIVIQRLFAAGMFLQGGASEADDPAVARRVNTAIEAMDNAIRDLRASIFELGGRVFDGDLTTAVDDVCGESANLLGFRPEVTVDDPDWEAEDVRDDVLAVLREALANVARHAEATSVDVVLRSAAGVVSLTVSDDGRGMAAHPARSSGTRNMQDRARQRGGDCVWTGVAPHGTRVSWHVPVTAPAVEV